MKLRLGGSNHMIKDQTNHIFVDFIEESYIWTDNLLMREILDNKNMKHYSNCIIILVLLNRVFETLKNLSSRRRKKS